MYWKRMNHSEILSRVNCALEENQSYLSGKVLGIPGTYLDTDQFYSDAPFLKDAPFLRALVDNPNHIGCHTLNESDSEDLFRGTQKIEIELIELIARQILKAVPETIDGYVAPGGTEANIQAIWIYRNYFNQQFKAKNNEIGVVYSEDSHYSIPKGINILNVESIKVSVDESNRKINVEELEQKLSNAQQKGIKHFILIQNMSTTMFGSVDEIEKVVDIFQNMQLSFKCHIDGAFGGFFYPFTNESNALDFTNEFVTSITLDAHKMLQAPYGTGIFLVRKDWMKYTQTKDAQYVQGLDYTLCGSRSGANAIAIYMILMTHGSEGWKSKVDNLLYLTDKLCAQFDQMNIRYFRNPYMNIVAINAEDISGELAMKYRLVADSYVDKPKYWKIVVMPHVTSDVIEMFLNDLEKTKVLWS